MSDLLKRKYYCASVSTVTGYRYRGTEPGLLRARLSWCGTTNVKDTFLIPEEIVEEWDFVSAFWNKIHGFEK